MNPTPPQQNLGAPGSPVWVAPPDRLVRPRALEPTTHTTLLAVDIQGFGAVHRTDDDRLRMRQAMYEYLMEAFDIGHLPWWDCYREDRGDGALIIAPPELDAVNFLDPLAHHLTAVLRRYQHLADDLTRVRLRMAVVTGRVHHDAHGVTGHATVTLFRLLEAAAFKRMLTRTKTDLGVIVSNELYQDVTQNGALVNPASYRHIRVTNKQLKRCPAWVWLPPTAAHAAHLDPGPLIHPLPNARAVTHN